MSDKKNNIPNFMVSLPELYEHTILVKSDYDVTNVFTIVLVTNEINVNANLAWYINDQIGKLTTGFPSTIVEINTKKLYSSGGLSHILIKCN